MTRPRSSSSALSTVLPLILASVCVHAAMAGTRMVAPLVVLHDGYGKTAAGILFALFAVIQVFLSLPAGRYADRHGLRRPLAWSVVAATVGIGAAAIWPTYGVLCVAASLTGAAAGAAIIALQRHVGRSAVDAVDRMRVFSWLSIAPAVANFVGPYAAGVAMDQFGDRIALAMLAVLPPIAWLLARNTPEPRGDAAVPEATGGAAELLRDPQMRRLMTLNLMMNASWDLHVFMVPLLGFERGLSASSIGFILGIFALAAAFIRVFMPAISRHVAEWKLISGALALAGILLILYPLTNSASTMTLCSAALGFVLGSVQPNVMVLLHHLTPSHRHGEALALRVLLLNVSAVVLPIVLGATSGLIGANVAFWTIGAVVGSGSWLGRALRSADVRGRKR